MGRQKKYGCVNRQTNRSFMKDQSERVKTKDVIVVPYNEEWPAEFNKIKELIAGALGSAAISIEHVGSTSVAGLWAKPIIDIDVVIKDESILSRVIEQLDSIGYHFRGDLGIQDRYAFRCEDMPHLMSHNLYVCPQYSKELKRHLCFRDYLRSHPEAVQKYSEVKREGAALFPHDIDAYINYKTSVIEEIYRMCGL